MANIKNYIQNLANAFKGQQMANKSLSHKLANLPKNDKRIIDKIVQSFISRTKQDIGSWRTALTLAENTANPQRFRYYQLCKDVMLDDQVMTCMSNLKASIKSEGFYIGNAANGEKDDKATELILRPWFYDFINSCIDSTAWGFVLLELADLVKTNMGVEIASFDEVPREHVIPERGLVVIKIGDDKGISFTDPMFAKTIFPLGKKNNLGLLNPVAPKAIIKKNVEAAWAEFCEMFGMPIRVGKVASRNQADLDRMESFLKAMGSAAYAVTGTDDTIELKETSRGDAYQVYDKLMERQDKAISKIFLGQTMTTDNGSSRSQAEVHERVGKDRIFELKLFIEFTVNFQLFPFLIANGYKLNNLKFFWDASTEITETDIKKDEFLVNHFEFEDLKYFVNKYRVPIKGVKEITNSSIEFEPTPKPPKSKLSNIELLNNSIEKLYNHHAH